MQKHIIVARAMTDSITISAITNGGRDGDDDVDEASFELWLTHTISGFSLLTQ